MNFTLYKAGIRNVWKLFVILFSVIAMYYVIIIGMFDSEMSSLLSEFEQLMPEMMASMGMSGEISTLVSFTANYLYGFIMLILPMVFTIIVANRLVAYHIDRGSMAYLMAAPISKIKIIMTQLTVLITGIFAMIIFTALTGIIFSALYFPGELDISKFLIMNLGTLALQLFIGGICFLSSCIFNDTKNSLAVGAGITSFAYILQMMASAGSEFENIKYFTFFTLFMPKDLALGNSSANPGIVILLAGAAVLFTVSVIIFNKKDMPVI